MFEPFEFFLGHWSGIGTGQPGTARYERTYELILNGQFIWVKNKSIWAPREDNPSGEEHEDWGFISYDKSRKNYIYRQFHVEGFVNQYVLEPVSAEGQPLVFTSESIENIAAGWRARENYKIISPDEFIEIFELAEPGKGFERYSECHLIRIKS